MRRKFVAGNWKMHGSLAANAKLLDAVLGGLPASDAVETAVCVPFPYLAQAREKLAGTRVAWGAQNLSQHAQGAYTGEVSAAMLLDFVCRYVIVGHTERRSLYGDSDALVAAKYDAALKAGLTPILCLGESLEQRGPESPGRAKASAAARKCFDSPVLMSDSFPFLYVLVQVLRGAEPRL